MTKEAESTYLSINKRSEGIYKEKGSKFIGIAQKCFSEEQAKELLEIWRNEHHQARHLCYAYRFGLDKSVYRTNDDGEPSNSAGAPILGQIQSFSLSNILIGVVRYYGGTKLGVGGLINAYRTAAKDAIENGKIKETEVFYHVNVQFEYPQMPHLMQFLKQNDLQYSNQNFEISCSLDVALPLGQKEYFLDKLNEFEESRVEFIGEH